MKITDVMPYHLDEIIKIENLCFSLPWSRSMLEKQMNSERSIFLAAVDDKDIVLGYVGLMFVLDEGYISNVAVSPEHRRKGIADCLIASLVERTKNTLAFLTLEVRENNLAAISLYKKHGFKAVGFRKNYYDKPKENAIIMTLFFDREENKEC